MKHKYKQKRHKFKYHKNGNGKANGNHRRINWRELIPHLVSISIITGLIWGYGIIYLGLVTYGSFTLMQWTAITMYWLAYITFYLLGNELHNWWLRLERKLKPMQLQKAKCQLLSFGLGSMAIVYTGQWAVFWLVK